MCGINGILYFNSHEIIDTSRAVQEKIKLMNDEIIHRGPDDEGVLVRNPVGFGFRRLSIIDLSQSGHQPMFNEDKTIAIVFNGEIYNYQELIPDLKSKGHIFASKTDTEVIIHSYEEYGFDCVKRFNGMWAFSIYDFKKNILFASRDRFGVKPFYYYKDSNTFIFSSEIKAILKVTGIRNANHGKVFDYLAYGYKTTNGDTFFDGISELKPAHNIVIQNGNFSLKKFWDFPDIAADNDDHAEQLKHLLEDSVRIRFRSDVPVSILLSGGIDSGIITKIADDHVETGQIKNENIAAFSAVFPGFKYDESKYIDELAASCKHISLNKLTPGTNDFVNSIDKFVYGMGEPVFSTTSYAHFTLMKEIKKNNIKVVLNGQGADETWCGYGRYIMGYFLLDLLSKNPVSFYSQMNQISDKMRFSYKTILSQTFKAMMSRRKASLYRSKNIEKTKEVLSESFVNDNSGYFTNSSFKKFSGNTLADYTKYNIQYQGFGQILHYEDHSSMQNSIEMRSPFLDYRIVELAFSIPTRKKFDNGVTKKILRETFKEKLPSSIVNNHGKIGFVTPFDDWIKDAEIKQYITDIIQSESFRNKKILSPGKVEKAFNNQESYSDFPLWRFINLELWSRAYAITNL